MISFKLVTSRAEVGSLLCCPQCDEVEGEGRLSCRIPGGRAAGSLPREHSVTEYSQHWIRRVHHCRPAQLTAGGAGGGFVVRLAGEGGDSLIVLGLPGSGQPSYWPGDWRSTRPVRETIPSGHLQATLLSIQN